MNRTMRKRKRGVPKRGMSIDPQQCESLGYKPRLSREAQVMILIIKFPIVEVNATQHQIFQYDRYSANSISVNPCPYMVG